MARSKTEVVQAPEPVAVVETEVARLDALPPPAATPPIEASLPGVLRDRIAAARKEIEECGEELKRHQVRHTPGAPPVTLHGRVVGAPAQHSLTHIDPRVVAPGRVQHWSHKTMVDYHRAQGYSPVDHDRFAEAHTAVGLSLRWTKTAEGHVQNGDLILVETSADRWRELMAVKAQRNKARQGQAKANLQQAQEAVRRDYGHAVDGMEVFENELRGRP